MKIKSFKIAAALLPLLLASFAVPGGAVDCKGLSAAIARAARANAMGKIAVLGFVPRGGAEKGESDYIAEKVGMHLAGAGSPQLIERALLGKVLGEARLSSMAGGSAGTPELLHNMLSIDAVVTGSVFADGRSLKILAKLIDIKTGRVLLAAEAVSERILPDTLGDMFDAMGVDRMELPDPPSGWVDEPAPGTDFRDAVADRKLTCGERRVMMGKLNSELVDDKAKYWAATMRRPDFKAGKLTRNPGSEISDPAVKARFYELLGLYSKEAAALPPGPDRLARVMVLMKAEKEVSDECGFL